MSDESPLTVGRTSREQAGPFAKLIIDARAQLGFSERGLAAEITEAAYELDQQTTTVFGSAVWRWERGTVARKELRRWTAHVFQKHGLRITEADLAAAARAQQNARRLSHQRRSRLSDLERHSREMAATAELQGSPHAPEKPLPYDLSEDEQTMLRRQFLHQLLSAAGASAMTPAHRYIGAPIAATNTELLLHECESNIRACWRLMQGRDMVVVPTVLTSWLPLLDSMLRQSAPQHRHMAALAAEGYMLAGLVTVLQGHHDRAELCCQQAVEYAAVAGHPDIIVAALKHLATKYLSAHYPLLTLRTYERAIPYLADVSPLLRGRTHLGLALAYAQVGNRSDAERHLKLVYETFPDDPESDRAFVYADARRASLDHYGGLIHLAFDRPQQAWETFASAIPDPATGVPERTVIQIVNCQAEAAIALRDVELASVHLEAAVSAARNLGSLKRVNDSSKLFSQLRSRWPTDRRVKRLESLFDPGGVVPSLPPGK